MSTLSERNNPANFPRSAVETVARHDFRKFDFRSVARGRIKVRGGEGSFYSVATEP